MRYFLLFGLSFLTSFAFSQNNNDPITLTGVNFSMTMEDRIKELKARDYKCEEGLYLAEEIGPFTYKKGDLYAICFQGNREDVRSLLFNNPKKEFTLASRKRSSGEVLPLTKKPEQKIILVSEKFMEFSCGVFNVCNMPISQLAITLQKRLAIPLAIKIKDSGGYPMTSFEGAGKAGDDIVINEYPDKSVIGIIINQGSLSINGSNGPTFD